MSSLNSRAASLRQFPRAKIASIGISPTPVDLIDRPRDHRDVISKSCLVGSYRELCSAFGELKNATMAFFNELLSSPSSFPSRLWLFAWRVAPWARSRGLFGVPFVPERLEFFRFLGLVGGQVLRLADVGRQVVELRLLVLPPLPTDQLPIAVADRPLIAEPPVKRLVRRGRCSRRSDTAAGSRRRASTPDRSLAPAAARHVGRMSSWMTGWS